MEHNINNISFYIDEYEFNLKKNTDYYIIICNDKNTFDWIDVLNMYSINKKPSKDKLIEKIKMKFTNNLINIKENNIKENNIKQNETKEMKIYKELDRIKKLNYNLENNTNIAGAKKLFNNSTIKDILINEYIKIWQSNSDKLSIMINDNIYIWTITFNHKQIGNILMSMSSTGDYRVTCS